MGFKFNEEDFFVCLWHAEDLEGNNFLMFLRRRGEYWFVDCRFRHKLDDKIFDSKDERSFYQTKMPSTTPEPEMLRGCRVVFQKVSEKYGCKCFSQRIDGGAAKMVEVMKRFPDYFHMQVVKEGDSL